jgi:hypothetical protein
MIIVASPMNCETSNDPSSIPTMSPQILFFFTRKRIWISFFSTISSTNFPKILGEKSPNFSYHKIETYLKDTLPAPIPPPINLN